MNGDAKLEIFFFLLIVRVSFIWNEVAFIFGVICCNMRMFSSQVSSTLVCIWYTQWINQFKTSWSISLLYRKSMPCAHCLCTTPTVHHQTIAAKPTRIETIVLTQSKIVFNTGQYISHFVSEWGIKRLYTAMCNLCRLNEENDCLISDYSYFFWVFFLSFRAPLENVLNHSHRFQVHWNDSIMFYICSLSRCFRGNKRLVEI